MSLAHPYLLPVVPLMVEAIMVNHKWNRSVPKVPLQNSLVLQVFMIDSTFTHVSSSLNPSLLNSSLDC